MFEKVVLVMGLFAFAKQAPKLIGDVLGIDSGNMKLGIGGKLAAGGLLGAAAVMGGGLRTGINNITHGFGKAGDSINNFKSAKGFKKIGAGVKAVGSVVGHGFIGGVVSGAAGALSAGGRVAKNGAFSAKNASEARKSYNEGFTGAITARDKRENYRATHGGTFGAMVGHTSDATDGVLSWMGINSIDQIKAEQARAQEVANARKAVADRAKAIMERQKTEREATVGQTTHGGYYKNLAEIENQIAYAQQNGTLMDGTTSIDAKALVDMQNAKAKLEKQLQADIVAGISAKTGALDMAAYDGELMSAVSTFRTKLSSNYNSILRNADRDIAEVNTAIINLEAANAASSQKINDFISTGNVSRLFDGKDAIDNANRKLSVELNARILKEQENKK